MRLLPTLILFLSTLAFSVAEVRLPALFADHMVLQRGQELPVWGWAKPGEKVVVSFAGQTVETEATADGRWGLKLAPLEASAEPAEFHVRGANTLVLKDVLVGDVWVWSGQSNLAWSLARLKGSEETIAKANYPQLRFFSQKREVALAPVHEPNGHWEACMPETAAQFSGTGFFFGRMILETQKVPVGLISAAVGGTPAQAWTRLEALEAVPELKHYAEGFLETKKNLPELVKKYETETLPQWEVAEAEWQKMAEKAKAEGKKPDPPKPPRKPVVPDKNTGLPTVLYNGMISPLMPYGIRGVIWYQGEANAKKADEYAVLFPAMIRDWRDHWGQGDFPFLFVQLASYHPDTWPALRNAQLKSLSVPRTAMAVAIDVGEERDIHPANKKDVGERLALAARALAYGEDLVYSGPIYQSMEAEEGKIRVRFDHVGGGLKLGSALPIEPGNPFKEPLDQLVGFEVAGTDGQFIAAQAMIDGESVVVWSDSVSAPKAVRYAWAGFPQANLYNEGGLPTSPFSSLETPGGLGKRK